MADRRAGRQANGGTLAVVINRTGVATERFVERHIRESFDGRTVVVARHAGG